MTDKKEESVHMKTSWKKDSSWSFSGYSLRKSDNFVFFVTDEDGNHNQYVNFA